ncbi:MAG: hypothetical protein ACRDSS_07345, partial [Actinocrinis sp.]
LVAAVLGVALCFAASVVAYWTARLGFRLAGTQVVLPRALMVPAGRAVGLAALGGSLGVLGAALLRVRILAAFAALLGCSLVAMFLPGSLSVAGPYLARGARDLVRWVPGVTYSAVLDLALAVPLLVLALGGLVATRRRRIV